MRMCVMVALAGSFAGAGGCVQGQAGYLVAGIDSVLRYSADGSFDGFLIEPGTTLAGASQFTLSPDGGTLYVGTFRSDSNVSIFDATTGEFLGNLDDGGPLVAPSVVTFGPTGSLLVSDFSGGAVYEYDPVTRERLGTFFTGGSLRNPHEIIWDGSGYLVSDFGRNRVLRYDTEGVFERVILTAADDSVSRPLDMLLSQDGQTLYVSNNQSSQVTVYDLATETLIRTIGMGELMFPEGLEWAPDGSLIVANAGAGTIVRFDPLTGALLGEFDRVAGIDSGTTDVLFVPAAPAWVGLMLGGVALCRRRR